MGGRTVSAAAGTPSRPPWALGLVAVGTLVLLFLMTGSVVMPVKALLMNVLSLGCSLGALTLVFQHGWFSGLLGFAPTGGLETFIPVLVFAFAFDLLKQRVDPSSSPKPRQLRMVERLFRQIRLAGHLDRSSIAHAAHRHRLL